MKGWVRWLLVAGAVVVAAIAGYWFGSSGGGSSGGGGSGGNGAVTADAGPVVPVATAPVERKRITETTTAYGRVVAQPGAVQVIAVPYEATVSHVLVTIGQPVRAGAALIRVAPSPATMLQLRQARTALSAAERNLRQVQQEYAQHLAVSTQLIAAQQSAETARAQVAQFVGEGASGSRTITARHAGVVSAVSATDGQLAAAGTPLVALAVGKRMEAQLGIEPEDAASLHVGDPIRLMPVNAAHPQPVIGRVRVVGDKADPKTQLIDVEVSLPGTTDFSLSSFVQGQLATVSDVGLVVPREALLPEGGRYKLFTIMNGKADEHRVDMGLESGSDVEIKGSGLKPGELVVTQGNYELSSGTAVAVRGRR